jgi:hypothetical protein
MSSSISSNADNYLHEAALANDPCSGTFYDPEADGNSLASLGVHEHWNNPTDKQYSCNLGTGGGIELISFESKTADFEPDGDVDISDLVVLTQQWLLPVLSMDVEPHEGDGTVNFLDWPAFADGWMNTTDINDLVLFADQWMQLGAYSADIAPFPDGDGIVNIFDFAALADYWLQCGPLEKASSPTPPDNEKAVDPNNVMLAWSAGDEILLHDVYFGTDANAVNDANHYSPQFMDTIASTTFDPGYLDPNTIYYWRIDKISERCMAKGSLWSFRTWLEPNLISWWKLDDGSGSTTSDSSRSNHGLVSGGAVWTTGKINGALSFGGGNGYVNCGNDTSLDITGSVSIAAWVRFDTLARSYQTILAKRGSSDDITSNYSIRTGSTAASRNDELEFLYHDGSGWHIYASSTANLTAATWYHVAATFTYGSGAGLECYVDANSVSGGWRLGNGDSAVQTNTKPVTTGGLTNGEFLDGKLDDIRIYYRALSGGEVLQLYNDGL